MRRLIFVNRYFHPDHSATSQILSDLAFHLAAAGREVHVVTGRQIYDNPRASLPATETVRDVHVHRVASTQFGRAGLLGRSTDYFSFYWSLRHGLAGTLRRGDILIVKTDPPLAAVLAMRSARHAGARLVNWLQDVYPEIAVELGVPLIRGPSAAALTALRNRSLQDAAATVAVGHAMAQKIESLGTPPTRIHVIANWCADEEITPIARLDNPLRTAWGLQDRFVVGYSGNLGRAHEFATVLNAAERLRGNLHIAFLMIGGGKGFDELAQAVKTRGLESLFRFVPYQNRELLSHSLAVPDIHWISLRPELEGLIVPSKFYGIAAAGRPIIVIGAREGELARLVEAHGCGATFSVGEDAALAEAIVRLAADSAAVAEMGSRARQMLEANFTRQSAFRRWRTLLDDLDRP